MQGKDTLNEKQSLPYQRWFHGPLFFICQFLRLALLLLLYNSGKLVIPHDHIFFLLHILHLFLFKLLRRQDNLSISGDSRIVFWWSRDVNCRLSFLGRADPPFVSNRFDAIYFQPIFDRQFRKHFLLVLQQCGDYCVVFSGRSTPFKISGCDNDLVDGAQYKCKCKP